MKFEKTERRVKFTPWHKRRTKTWLWLLLRVITIALIGVLVTLIAHTVSTHEPHQSIRLHSP